MLDLKNFIIYQFRKILVIMIILGVAALFFLPANTLTFNVFAIAWSAVLISLSLIVGDANKKLQDFEDVLHTTMDPAVVKLMMARKLRTENRPISVQFTDLQGFTSYAEENSAEVVLSELNTYLREMETILLQYRAHIDKYVGDGIMSEFGAPDTYIKHSLLAVASGLKMQQSIKHNQFPWPLRVGIATGVSTIGIIGTKRQAYTAFGDVVNLASRIEGLCAPGLVTVDEASYQASKEYFNFKQKSYARSSNQDDEALVEAIGRTQTELEKSQDNPELLLKLSNLLLEANDTQLALDYLNKAMALAPENDQIKLAYADASIKQKEQANIEVRGRKKTIQVYELIGLKNPLENFKNIPEKLYRHEKETMDSLVPFPEDILLPVECLDGSIGQAKLVGIVSYLLSVKLDLPTNTRKDILEAGYLADIGKSIVPESILNRPGQLTDEETKSIHLHPEASVRILNKLGYKNRDLIKIIANHHESINGSGYPKGISGEDIPIGSRILAVAEAYVSMTSNRPYRDAWEVKPAYQEIVKYSELGKFDKNVTKVLGDIVSELG